jgi:hypothetical protein
MLDCALSKLKLSLLHTDCGSSKAFSARPRGSLEYKSKPHCYSFAVSYWSLQSPFAFELLQRVFRAETGIA